MSDTEAEKKNTDFGTGDGLFAVPVKIGHGDERTIKLPPGAPITKILDVVSADLGCEASELTLSREGEDDLLTASVRLSHDYPHKRRHHVHRPGEVAVTVFYQDKVKTHSFKRRQTVEDVLIWAVRAFGIDPHMAGEFELTLHNQKEELPGSEHIGHLARKECELPLDLLRGDIANGSGS